MSHSGRVKKWSLKTGELLKDFKSYEILYDRTRQRCHFNTGIEVTSLAGLHMCIYYHSDNMFIGNLLKNSDLLIPIHATHVFFSAPKSPIFNSNKGQCIYIKLAFAVVPTDKICGRSLSLDLSGYCAINRMINKNSR
jgi:hypothetical protein